MLYIPNLTDRFTLLEKLGQGGYGSVQKAQDKVTGNLVAIKTIPEPESFVRELSLYRSLDHPNIASLLGWSFLESKKSPDEDRWYLVLPLGIPSRTAIKQGMISLDKAIYDIMSGITFLHHLGIYHGDIKDWNMVFIENRLVFVDFGLAERATPLNGRWYVRYVESTPGYEDPEFEPNDWNLIESELYAIAGMIWDFYNLTRGRDNIVIDVKPYGIITSNEKLNELLSALTFFPVSQRKSATEIWESWDPQQLIPGFYIQTAFQECKQNDNEIIEEFLRDREGNKAYHKFYDTYSARSVFAGCALLRSISSQVMVCHEELLNCLSLVQVIFREVKTLPNVRDILVASDGICILNNLWDTATSYDDLLERVKLLPTCAGIEDQQIPIQSVENKNLYFSAIVNPVWGPYPYNYMLKFNNITFFMANYKKFLTNKDADYFFFLHYRKFLPELPNDVATLIFDKLFENEYRQSLLRKMLKDEEIPGFSPAIKLSDFNIQPFQMSSEIIDLLFY